MKAFRTALAFWACLMLMLLGMVASLWGAAKAGRWEGTDTVMPLNLKAGEILVSSPELTPIPVQTEKLVTKFWQPPVRDLSKELRMLRTQVSDRFSVSKLMFLDIAPSWTIQMPSWQLAIRDVNPQKKINDPNKEAGLMDMTFRGSDGTLWKPSGWTRVKK